MVEVTRVVAVDWSGRAGPDQAKHIWLCEVVEGQVHRLEPGRSRTDLVTHLTELAEEDANLVVGLDFAFSLPEWYLDARGLASAPELWHALALEALTLRMRELGLRKWMKDPDPPFWCSSKPADLTPLRAFRRTEREVVLPGVQPKSVFQLVGAGQVGPGSLYGMQSLHQLAGRGFSIWPFDKPKVPLVVEIFPRTLTGPVVKSHPGARRLFIEGIGLEQRYGSVVAESEDAFDALISALVMAEASSSFDQLDGESGYESEGRIWVPPNGRVLWGNSRQPAKEATSPASATSGC